MWQGGQRAQTPPGRPIPAFHGAQQQQQRFSPKGHFGGGNKGGNGKGGNGKGVTVRPPMNNPLGGAPQVRPSGAPRPVPPTNTKLPGGGFRPVVRPSPRPGSFAARPAGAFLKPGAQVAPTVARNFGQNQQGIGMKRKFIQVGGPVAQPPRPKMFMAAKGQFGQASFQGNGKGGVLPSQTQYAAPRQGFMQRQGTQSRLQAAKAGLQARGGSFGARPSPGGPNKVVPASFKPGVPKHGGKGFAPKVVTRPQFNGQQKSAPPGSSTGGPPAKVVPATVTSKGPIEKKDPNEIKADVKMRKIEAMTKQMLDEFLSLAEDRKDESWSLVMDKLTSRVPGKYLLILADKCYANSDNADLPAASEVSTAASSKPAVVVKKEITSNPPKHKPVVKAAPAVAAAPRSDPNLLQVKDPSRFSEKMKNLLKAEPKDWKSVWLAQKIEHKDKSSALAALGEAAAEDGEIESVCTLLTTLATEKLISTSAVEAALAALAARLEDLVTVNENAWHLHTQSLYHFFPKTEQSSWGFSEKAWNWITWWQMVERVLSKADNFRAFDILVLVFQMMQEANGGTVIKEQQVWKEFGRLAKATKVLCKWGDMDEKGIIETLSAYGVEL